MINSVYKYFQKEITSIKRVIFAIQSPIVFKEYDDEFTKVKLLNSKLPGFDFKILLIFNRIIRKPNVPEASQKWSLLHN